MQSKSLDGTMVKGGVQENGRFLRNVLKANYIFSTVSGLSSDLVCQQHCSINWLKRADDFGGVRNCFIPHLLFTFTKYRQWNRSMLVWFGVIVVLDVLWVLASAVLLLSNMVPLTTAGKWIVGILADVRGPLRHF